MMTYNNIVSVGMFLVYYICMLWFLKPEAREIIKTYIYFLVFVGLFLPSIVILKITFNIQLYATVICGIELIDRVTKQIIKSRIDKGKKISSKVKRIYESL